MLVRERCERLSIYHSGFNRNATVHIAIDRLSYDRGSYELNYEITKRLERLKCQQLSRSHIEYEDAVTLFEQMW